MFPLGHDFCNLVDSSLTPAFLAFESSSYSFSITQMNTIMVLQTSDIVIREIELVEFYYYIRATEYDQPRIDFAVGG